jgi:protein TonB
LFVRSDNGLVLEAGTAAYKTQIKKYLPKDYSFDETTGAITSNHYSLETEQYDEAEVEVPTEVEQVEPEIFVYAEVMPRFPGDDGAFLKYLRENMKYPEIEKEAGKQGTVFVSFTVEKDGSITDVKAVKEVAGAPGFTKEAIRLISQMPNWNPGKMNGRPVRIAITQPVKFVLN